MGFQKYLENKRFINCNGKLIDLREPQVMGILNITPDSFFDGGKYNSDQLILERVEQMICDGADIIDIGAYSTRPGAAEVTEKEELERLMHPLEIIRKRYPDIVLSVDTFRARVAEEVVSHHKVDIINDISSGDLDEKMIDTMAALNVPYIIMHMKGIPENMQNNPHYKDDVMGEIIKYLAFKVELLQEKGVHDIVIDPGFGFGKTVGHNYTILKRLEEFKMFELPLLVGVSRKSMIYKSLGVTPEDALNGTTALNMLALQKGAAFLRVHDVKEAKECVKLHAVLQSV